MSSNKNNQSDEHQHRRLFTFTCGATVSPNTLFTAATWGALFNVIHVFYSVTVRDALFLHSILSLMVLTELVLLCACILHHFRTSHKPPLQK